jgi:hypothetical protein
VTTDHFGDPCVDARIVLKMDLKEIRYENVDWIHTAQDRHRWRAVVYMAMNRWVP